MDYGVRLTIQGEMGAPGSQLADYAMTMGMRADELGYATAWIPDHLNNARVGPGQKGPSLECFTSIAAILMKTSRITIGPHVYCNTFRNPALLAKMIATLDEFSKGRTLLSLGGGWFEEEAVSQGFSWDAHDPRMHAVKEATALIKRLWTEDNVTFAGEYYRYKDAYQLPKPYSKPHPPIWTPGESAIAREIVCQSGDYWLIYSKPPEVMAKLKDSIIKQAGRDIKLAASAVFISDYDDDKMLSLAKNFLKEREHRFKVKPTLENILSHNIIGDLATCRKQVKAYAEAGVDHLIIQPMPPKEGMELFAAEIMPRAGVTA
ncbi:MAG: LLM class flavin-dependent oxidoreductase [Gracilibacteraceae bacterium]|jgi:FMNH2-dependent dimethyl sulfone monooxygenase|nr:LLM class flavin-dependent oxidoreductase [Gracilibacteraceae bacterium]